VSYPALLMIARGSSASGYQGVLRLSYGRPEGEGDSDLATCRHAHRMSRTARDCAIRLGARWRMDRAAWDAAKHE
jgi:hypothetical protein